MCSAFKAAGVNTVWTSISRSGMESGMDYKICLLSLNGKIYKDLHFEKIVCHSPFLINSKNVSPGQCVIKVNKNNSSCKAVFCFFLKIICSLLQLYKISGFKIILITCTEFVVVCVS